MIAVTGGLGFIGSNLVHALVRRGHGVFVVDEIESGLRYLEDLSGIEVMDKHVFRARLDGGGPLPKFEAVFHQGACTDTMETDWDYLAENNLGDSYRAAKFCQQKRIPLIYASSAAIYGDLQGFREEEACEHPINLYAESKTLFDNWVRKHILPAPAAPIVGLRYFNVYGPREDHKGNMASVAYKMSLQQEESGEITLFSGSHGFADGEQSRDFVYIDDVVDVNLWFLDQSVSGIFNVGTGRAEPFNAIAKAVLAHGGGQLRYIPFPEKLKAQYQAWTQADLTRLRIVGYEWSFRDVAQGVEQYLCWLDDR
ncbi:MAG: ADP-glyceromanno-heptose 6-epimerase [Proteobacteria bacterium]|nr:ADP-glyceromanno-heptose 6-epimerase [Pseudomonadota bacterium]